MSTPRERLYHLLPAVHRARDAAEGEPLRALMAVLEAELEAVRADVETTWDNFFIETCEPWLVPYLAEHVAAGAFADPIDPDDREALGACRAFVANALSRRRRKGTTFVLEQLGRDVTGYPTLAVEYMARLATTVHLNHLRERADRAPALGTVDLRDSARLEQLGTPFDPHGRTIEVRSIASGRGRYNVPNVGLHLFRTRVFDVRRGNPSALGGAPGVYRFDPHGADIPLFAAPETEDALEHLADERNAPRPLSRRRLYDAMEADVLPASVAPFAIRIQSAGAVSEPLPIRICHLGDRSDGPPTRRPPAGSALVDPELGRLALHADDLPSGAEILVDYAYGLSSALGAGPFDRGASHARQLDGQPVTWQRTVSRAPELSGLGAPSDLEASLADAIAAWNAAAAPGVVGLIRLVESRTFEAPLDPIELPEGARLHLVGVGFSRIDAEDGSPAFTFTPNDARPVVRGPLRVRGGATIDEDRPGGLWINGLALEDGVRVEPGDLETLDLAYCTLVPPAGIEVLATPGSTNAALRGRLERCVSGPVVAAASTTAWTLSDTIVRAADRSASALSIAGAALGAEACTIYGETRIRTLSASDCLFDGHVQVAQHQEGCLRFSYAPADAHTPRRYRCQPDLALREAPGEHREAVIARVRPSYASLEWGAPRFGRLRGGAPIELLRGAEDGNALGVFHHLRHATREARLRAALREYLRLGLEAGVLQEG